MNFKAQYFVFSMDINFSWNFSYVYIFLPRGLVQWLLFVFPWVTPGIIHTPFLVFIERGLFTVQLYVKDETDLFYFGWNFYRFAILRHLSCWNIHIFIRIDYIEILFTVYAMSDTRLYKTDKGVKVQYL